MMIEAVHLPESAEAVAGHSARGCHIMGGGTVVMPMVALGTAPGGELVSLRRAGLAAIEIRDGTGTSTGVATGVGEGSGPEPGDGPDTGTGSGAVVAIGAAATLADVEEHPALGFLRPALRTIASPTIRNLATVGGNLFVAQPYGDLAVCLLALDATCEITGPGGRRAAPVAEVLASGVAAGEFVTAVVVALPEPGTWHYHKAMRRKLNSASIVTVASVTRTDDGVVTSTRIALGGVAPRPVRAVSAERLLLGRPLTPEVLAEAGQAARADAAPFDDAYASAWYRDRVLPVHLRRALLDQPAAPTA